MARTNLYEYFTLNSTTSLFFVEQFGLFLTTPYPPKRQQEKRSAHHKKDIQMYKCTVHQYVSSPLARICDRHRFAFAVTKAPAHLCAFAASCCYGVVGHFCHRPKKSERRNGKGYGRSSVRTVSAQNKTTPVPGPVRWWALSKNRLALSFLFVCLYVRCFLQTFRGFWSCRPGENSRPPLFFAG